MSLIALSLNVLLAVLLTAALIVGWRVERRLKALRDSHDSFVKSVADLDRAAARAEQGLADLRAATDEAADSLGERIRKAELLTARLEAAPARRETVIDAAPPARDNGRATGAWVPRADRNSTLPRPSLREERAALERDVEARVAPLIIAPRSRARVDDDLFEEPVRRTAGLRP